MIRARIAAIVVENVMKLCEIEIKIKAPMYGAICSNQKGKFPSLNSSIVCLAIDSAASSLTAFGNIECHDCVMDPISNLYCFAAGVKQYLSIE